MCYQRFYIGNLARYQVILYILNRGQKPVERHYTVDLLHNNGLLCRRAGGTAPATPPMAGPKFCEPVRKLSARAKINVSVVSHQEITISYQRDLELKTLTVFKWSNSIAVSNHFGNWLIFKRAASTLCCEVDVAILLNYDVIREEYGCRRDERSIKPRDNPKRLKGRVPYILGGHFLGRSP